MNVPQVRVLTAALRALELVLMVAGVAALVWYGSVRVATARDQATWASELDAQIESRQEAGKAMTTTAGGDVRPIKGPGSVVGRLELRRLGLSAMAREGTEPALLDRAVGHLTATALPGETGNAAFAGHRDTFFRPLERVRAGDEIVVTTYSGRHRYVVRDTRVVPPQDLSVLDPTPTPTLTLITCFPFSYLGAAPERFIVRADLVGR